MGRPVVQPVMWLVVGGEFRFHHCSELDIATTLAKAFFKVTDTSYPARERGEMA